VDKYKHTHLILLQLKQFQEYYQLYFGFSHILS